MPLIILTGLRLSFLFFLKYHLLKCVIIIHNQFTPSLILADFLFYPKFTKRSTTGSFNKLDKHCNMRHGRSCTLFMELTPSRFLCYNLWDAFFAIINVVRHDEFVFIRHSTLDRPSCVTMCMCYVNFIANLHILKCVELLQSHQYFVQFK